MKSLRYFMTFIVGWIIISACQKELSQSSFLPASGNLVKTTSGDCAPVIMGGVYVINTPLVPANYMDVQVNFTATGDYEIISDTVNGYSFKGTGQAVATGLSLVRLTAIGTPLIAGTDVFNIRFDTSTCLANVMVNDLLAVYTFGNIGGVCSTPVIAGTYFAGVAVTSAHSATIQVNVSSPGAYSISTDTVNGISFSASGNFTSTGQQTVTLNGSGTPLAAASSVLNIAVTGGCSFVVPVVNTSGSLAQLTTTAVTGITCTDALSGGNITSDGGSAITARGICYALTADPSTANSIISSGSGAGVFNSTITGLAPGNTYHVRAFATNSAGTAYGNDISFTTATGCQATIYVAGRDDVYNISGNIPSPKVWTKTGGTFAGTTLPHPSGVYDSEAKSVFATATDVYVAGHTDGKATLWKNGIATQLDNGLALSVYVSGTDVYVAGITQAFNATVWKNGIATNLTAPLGGEAHSVFVSGSDVYVAGRAQEQIGPDVIWVAKLWKNGTATSLSNGAEHATGTSVYVSGNDVYVAITDGDVAKVWKNGVTSILPVSGSNMANANSVFVSGTDVYVAGSEQNGTSINSFAKLWKNGIGTNLTSTSNYRNEAHSVYVVGSTVYVAGSTTGTGANSRASVWINGALTNLTSGSADAYGWGIFVR